MKPDSMLVEADMIVVAYQRLAKMEGATALEQLRQLEPALGGWVEQQLLIIAGKMSICGTPQEVVAGSHGDMLMTILTAHQNAAGITQTRPLQCRRRGCCIRAFWIA